MQHGTTAQQEGATPARQDFLDPVCGMHVSETSPHRQRLGDVEYRFCSAHCRERFAANPTRFLKTAEKR